MSSRALLVGILVVAALVTGVTAIGAAVEDPADRDLDRLDLDEDNETDDDDEEDSDETTTVVAEVDSRLRVTGYSYDDNRSRMLVELDNRGDSTSHVTLTEVVEARDDETGTFGIEVVSVDPGETIEVAVSVERIDGDARVLVTTQESVEQGQGTFLTDSEDSSLGMFDGPATRVLIRLAALGAAFGVVLIVMLTAWHLIADRRDYAEVSL